MLPWRPAQWWLPPVHCGRTNPGPLPRPGPLLERSFLKAQAQEGVGALPQLREAVQPVFGEPTEPVREKAFLFPKDKPSASQ